MAFVFSYLRCLSIKTITAVLQCYIINYYRLGIWLWSSLTFKNWYLNSLKESVQISSIRILDNLNHSYNHTSSLCCQAVPCPARRPWSKQFSWMSFTKPPAKWTSLGLTLPSTTKWTRPSETSPHSTSRHSWRLSEEPWDSGSGWEFCSSLTASLSQFVKTCDAAEKKLLSQYPVKWPAVNTNKIKAERNSKDIHLMGLSP